MAAESAVATTALMNPLGKEERSDIFPITQGDSASPRKWMTNRFTAIAVARMWAPTELMIAAFSGAVLSRTKNAATRRAGNIADPLVKSAIIIAGTPIARLTAETR